MSGTGSYMAPYREIGVVEIEPSGPRHGRLSAAIPPPHVCELPVPCSEPKPSLWMLLLAALGIKPLQEVFLYQKGDFWRCSCGRVFRFMPNEPLDPDTDYSLFKFAQCRCGFSRCHYWRKATTKEWLDHGGSE